MPHTSIGAKRPLTKSSQISDSAPPAPQASSSQKGPTGSQTSLKDKDTKPTGSDSSGRNTPSPTGSSSVGVQYKGGRSKRQIRPSDVEAAKDDDTVPVKDRDLDIL
jgi:hypothetical protein